MPTPDEFRDPSTLVVTSVQQLKTDERAGGSFHEWALIRYVGQPIGEVILIGSLGLTIGRASDNSMRLMEAEVSRHHTRLSLVPDENGSTAVELSDMGSTNGTYVNGQRFDAKSGAVRLRQGDVIRIGGHSFRLKRMDDLERVYHDAVMTQTTVDPLTGVSNRATVLNQMEKHFELAHRHRRPMSLILCDIDFFKTINDTHGHPVGDLVLQGFGGMILTKLRTSDQVGRIGGEEFLVVLPETHLREASGVAEKLRKSVEEMVVPSPRGPIRITCSFGVTEISPTDPNAGSLLARTDLALYRAKGLGRNRIEADPI